MGFLQIALGHYRRQKALARRAAREVSRLWSLVDRGDIGGSWGASIPAALTVVSRAQALAASASGPYLDDVLAAQGINPAAEGRIRVDAFAGVASDGRDLETLLFQPAITSLVAIGRGATATRATAIGRVELDMIVRTQVADAGRVADGVATTARLEVAGYVRMLVPPSCSRCVLLAGEFYEWNRGFQRHPRCDCRHIPADEDSADDARTDPVAYFESLDEAEQDRVFTKAGAQAIRDGADIFRVVNARRGMNTAAGPAGRNRLARDDQGLFTTTEGVTRRGRLPGQTRGARLMPESIYELAKGDREEAIRLLRFHGYI